MKTIRLTKEFTIRDSRAVDLYFLEIQKYKTLTAEEEVELCEKIKQGDMEARKKLILHNLRFVISVAKRYQSLGYKLGDLIAIGNIGIIKAAEAFDHTRGFKFISYAVWWIRQQIMSEIGFRNNGIKIPGNRVSLMYRINKFKDKFYTENQRDPLVEEIAEGVGVDYEIVKDVIAASETLSSLDAPIEEGEDKEMSAFLEDESDFENEFAEEDRIRNLVHNALSVLNPKERFILKSLFGIECREKTLDELSEMLGQGKESIRSIRKAAMEKIKMFLKEKT
nr:MAG TPA: DNA directed RNA polymerase subunit [Caudoviricetes sp.]